MVIEAFETERLKIREYTRRDIDAFLSVIQQPEIRATTVGIPEDYTRSRAKEWFRFLQQARTKMQSLEYGVFLKNTRRYVGNVGLINISLQHNHADISYYIDRDHQNIGIATEAAAEMLRFGFCDLGFEKISGVCLSVNPASRRVMEKLGMKYEGTSRHELLKNGVYYDTDRLSILKNEYITNCKS